MTLYDERGRRLELAAQGHSGGEGTVYRIDGDRSRVAKIYHPARLNDGLHTKLRVMLDHAPADPSWTASSHRSIAWVDGLVFADSSGRDFRGFTMPYVDTSEFRQAHVYYDASDRLREFGGAFTWRHLMFAAHNLASAVAAVHAAEHRVGDLRETNLLVAPTALVTLIDCDSFQIRDPLTQQVHPTRVATGDYLPPELQGVDFRTQHPDRYHGDLFALAVLVFRFLMLGVHPFQSRGNAVIDAPSTEAKISKGLFAFSGHRRGVEPPDYSPPFGVIPKSLQALAVRAFVRGHRDPSARPTAAEWASALETEGRRLRKCGTNANHWYACGARSCPWCRISPDPFPARATFGRQFALEAAAGQIPEAARVEQVRAFARVALADGPITDAELSHLRKAGGELGLKTAIVDRVVDVESRRAGSPVAPPQPITPTSGASPSSFSWTAVRGTLTHPVRTARNRRTRSAWKAAAPVLICCALVGALAPVIAPATAALVALPVLATIGETRRGQRWRDRASLPLRFLVHAYNALGHAAKLFVPLAIVGLAVSFAPGVRADWIVRGMGAVTAGSLAALAITRFPSSNDRSGPSLRSGRDLVWRALVGDSGRARRPAYALWAVCAGVALMLGANVGLWWPLSLR